MTMNRRTLLQGASVLAFAAPAARATEKPGSPCGMR